MLKIIQNLKPDKGHGHDKINNEMLTVCENSLFRSFGLIFNNCLANGTLSPD